MTKRMELERRRLGYSKARLARESGLNVTSVHLISSGRLLPYPSQQERLERVLRIESGHLLDEIDEEVGEEVGDEVSSR